MCSRAYSAVGAPKSGVAARRTLIPGFAKGSTRATGHLLLSVKIGINAPAVLQRVQGHYESNRFRIRSDSFRPMRGRFAIVTNAGWNAVDARASGAQVLFAVGRLVGGSSSQANQAARRRPA